MRMQLDKKKNITSLLTAATCTLLGASPAGAEESKWQLDTALLYYDEGDRVTAAEPAISAKKTFADDSKISLKLVFDSLTGASHNGAAINDTEPQTFTGPSGAGSYIAQPGEVPLDDNFKDQRTAISAQWSQPVNRLLTWTVGGNISSEYDFDSMSINGGISRDFNKRNTTLNVGLSYEKDNISPVGGVPDEYSQYSSQLKLAGDEDKSVVDLLVGVTQVINRNTIMQFNLGYSSSSGYLTDPYKIVTIQDSTGTLLDYVYEQRPDSRKKNTFYWKAKHHLEKDVIDVSYRLMTDDWGIDSHTLDFKYRWQKEKFYVEPHFRYYTQSEADFYRVSMNSTDLGGVGGPVVIDRSAFPSDVSADYRLSALDTNTLGVKVGYMLGDNKELSFRLEYYQQDGDTKPADLDAVIFQAGYSFTF